MKRGIIFAMDLRQKWKAALNNLQFRFGPKVAESIVSISTLGARFRLYRQPPLRILIDNTVLFHAVTHETAWVTTGTAKWGEHDIETGYGARIPVHTEKVNTREYQNVSYLAGIAHLARLGIISLMTSSELMTEQWKHPSGRYSGYGYFDHNLFTDIKMNSVDGGPNIVIGPDWMNFPSIEEAQRERLASSMDPLYLGIAKHLGPKNSQDAWHLRTAEAHDMFCFLTMDFKLCKALEGLRKQKPFNTLRTRVMTPSQLGHYLGLLPVNPRHLSYVDASFPVRSDLYWPNVKRQKPKRKRSD